MATPTFRFERWSQGYKKIAVSSGAVIEISVNRQGGTYDVFTGDFKENVLDLMTNAGGSPGMDPNGTLVSVSQDERDSPRVTALTLRMDSTFAQNNGTPDPATLVFDVLVDGVSVLAAPISYPGATDTDVVIPMPLAAPFVVAGLQLLTVTCSVTWSGNEEGGDYRPGFAGLTIEATVE